MSHADALEDSLKAVADHYARLRNRWRGTTADAVTEVWDDTLDRIKVMSHELRDIGTKVIDASEKFEEQDRPDGNDRGRDA